MIPSAMVSNELLESYSLDVLFRVLYDAVVQAALDDCPVTVSGMVNIPVLLKTCNCLLAESQDLTSAVILEVPPATISPTVKSPVPPVATVSYTHLRAHET